MDDNAGSHDLPKTDVHPEANAEATLDSVNNDPKNAEDTSNAHDVAVDLDEEGFDPATLANLAALSRLARDEGDQDEDIEHDFSSLVPDQQQHLTTEQVRDIVSRLGEEKEKDGELDIEPLDGETDGEREETETDGARDDESRMEGDEEYKAEGSKSKRKRNRTLL